MTDCAGVQRQAGMYGCVAMKGTTEPPDFF